MGSDSWLSFRKCVCDRERALFAPFIDGKAAELCPDGQEKGIVESPFGVYSWDESTNHLGRNDQDRAARES